MGHITHSLIAVTGRDKEVFEGAVAEARSRGLLVLGPTEELLNDFRTFAVCSNGSKSGWSEARDYNSLTGDFVEYLDGLRYEDGSPRLEWVFLAYGNDDGGSRIVDTAWAEDY